MTPYWSRDGVTLYHGACVDVLAGMPPASVGLVLTDPPFCRRVHDGMRSNKGRRGYKLNGGKHKNGCKIISNDLGNSVNPIDFPPMTVEESAAAFAAMGRVARRWVVANVALEHAAALAEDPPSTLKPVRTGAWVKIGPTPQMTGDRPAQGFEALAMLHRVGEGAERMRWNGGGRAAVYHCQAEMRGEYPTQKPERLITRLLLDFAEPYDDVLDPFCGGGTTLLCAWRFGHRAVGCDVREEALEVTVRRLEAAMRQGRMPSAARAPASADQVSLL